MSDGTEHSITADFDVSTWEPTPYVVEGTNSELSTVRAVKIFEGSISGTSVADLLLAGNAAGAGYVGSEVFAGSVEGREGTMVMFKAKVPFLVLSCCAASTAEKSRSRAL